MISLKYLIKFKVIMKKIRKTSLLFSLALSTPATFLSSVIISCTNKNQVSLNDNNKQFKEIKTYFENLEWNNFLLDKKMKELKKDYKEFTYESFFEWDNDKQLSNLQKIEINDENDVLSKKKAREIDNDITRKIYLPKKINDLIDDYNNTKDEKDKLVVIFRSQKLPKPEDAILVWVWLTQKKYLDYNNLEIKNLKYLISKKVILYGHWFYNEEYQNKKSNKVWKILQYTVPTIAIGGLFLYVIIALLVKRKKKAFKNKK